MQLKKLFKQVSGRTGVYVLAVLFGLSVCGLQLNHIAVAQGPGDPSQTTPGPEKTPKPGKTPKPRKTPKPGKTPKPAKTPKPKKTPKPGKTPKPAKTPKPGKNTTQAQANQGEIAALAAIQNAINMSGDPKKIEKAQEELAKAAEDFAKGKFGDALKHYFKAIEEAQKSLE